MFPYLAVLQKNYNAQFTLLNIKYFWEKIIQGDRVKTNSDKKAFDIINQSVLLEKSETHGFS